MEYEHILQLNFLEPCSYFLNCDILITWSGQLPQNYIGTKIPIFMRMSSLCFFLEFLVQYWHGLNRENGKYVRGTWKCPLVGIVASALSWLSVAFYFSPRVSVMMYEWNVFRWNRWCQIWKQVLRLTWSAYRVSIKNELLFHEMSRHFTKYKRELQFLMKSLNHLEYFVKYIRWNFSGTPKHQSFLLQRYCWF